MLNFPHLTLIAIGCLLIVTATLTKMPKLAKVIIVLSGLGIWGAAVYLLLNPYVEYGYLVQL